LTSCGRMQGPTAGFWYDTDATRLPDDAARALGGPLMPEEIRSVTEISRTEIEHAFSALRMTVTDKPAAFWRVKVVQSLPVRPGQALPNAGESLALGALGGIGEIGFDIVSRRALFYAPTGASRGRIVEAIGRGIGRVAVHEFVHQMLGGDSRHNDTDENSYEDGSPDRFSQYYGELHWTTAWPLLLQKFGT
jgi:hypothetical protein